MVLKYPLLPINKLVILLLPLLLIGCVFGAPPTMETDGGLKIEIGITPTEGQTDQFLKTEKLIHERLKRFRFRIYSTVKYEESNSISLEIPGVKANVLSDLKPALTQMDFSDEKYHLDCVTKIKEIEEILPQENKH